MSVELGAQILDHGVGLGHGPSSLGDEFVDDTGFVEPGLERLGAGFEPIDDRLQPGPGTGDGVGGVGRSGTEVGGSGGQCVDGRDGRVGEVRRRVTGIAQPPRLLP